MDSLVVHQFLFLEKETVRMNGCDNTMAMSSTNQLFEFKPSFQQPYIRAMSSTNQLFEFKPSFQQPYIRAMSSTNQLFEFKPSFQQPYIRAMSSTNQLFELKPDFQQLYRRTIVPQINCLILNIVSNSCISGRQFHKSIV